MNPRVVLRKKRKNAPRVDCAVVLAVLHFLKLVRQGKEVPLSAQGIANRLEWAGIGVAGSTLERRCRTISLAIAYLRDRGLTILARPYRLIPGQTRHVKRELSVLRNRLGDDKLSGFRAEDIAKDIREEIIKMRYGIDYDRSYSLSEVGRRFNITRERARQIEAKILNRLRDLILRP